ncbi:outer membrane beta-barrel protein [Myxococcus sp. RHSTA-1-4]|uniref:outer membrane beta-barrel protein n=1 Tax=Myxococcus sp. RHSTA-1-4 TaxID=2874601 RepID=UPI001CBC6E77|nr:outer membrane beta-barrel protein [Myxococcus sp. RHSTA-1-4]MBZ4417651.1 porin family protein [Myxococcus sp. RHSTA-1-4]
MTHSTLWKLAALSLSLSAPAALAEGGALRMQDDRGYEDDAPAEADRGYEEDGRAAKDGGFALGFRTGFGMPFGKFSDTGDSDSGKVSDMVTGGIPLQVDAGYFINSRLYVGASFQYGLGFLSEDIECPDEASCSVSQLRFGVNVAYHFNATEKIDPWLGLGIGYESVDLSISASEGDASATASTSIRGFEFASVQGGFDYRVNKTFSVGPFVTFTAGQYSTVSTRIEAEGGGLDIDEEESEDIEEKAFHSWLYGGVRMQLRF